MTMTAEPAAARVETQTPATRVREWAQRSPDGIAQREKDLGVWQEITWRDYWESVLDIGHALLALGVEPGDRVAIHSENRPEWVHADVATVAVRGTTMGLYPTNPSPEVEYLLGNSESKLLIAEDQEQVDKVLEVKDRLPALERVIYIEPRGVRSYDDPLLMSWQEFLSVGRAHRAAHPGAVEQRMAEATEDDIAALVYTSGTTGPAKGAMLSIRNVEFAVATLVAGGGFAAPPPGPHDMGLSYLPLCHVVERVFTTWFNLGSGFVVNFAESIETVQSNLREVQPTIFFSVPRIWEKMAASVQIRAASASRLKRLNFGVWMRVAGWLGKSLVRNGGRHTAATRVVYPIGWLFLYRALKDRLGLRRCRHAASGAAPIAPELLEFFMGIGVPMHEAYGMTENTAVATANRPGRIKLGTVGEPHPDTELRLDETTGEILTRHPGNFVGYWRNPEATAATLDADGWLHTGDVGEWVDGTHVRIVGRIKEIIITSGGKNISPAEIENALKVSPFIKEAVVIGDRRQYLTALIGIEFDVVSEWAQRRKIPHTTYRDLSEKPEVIKLVQGVIDEVNAGLARVEQIKKFAMLPKELDHEDGELTATQKVKRASLMSMFDDLVESMYR